MDDGDPTTENPYAESDALIDAALGVADDGAADEDPAPERPVDKFRRTAAGTVVAAGLFGLRDALEGRPERDEPAIVVDAPTSQPTGPVEVLLDFDHPERSKVVIRRAPEPPDPPATPPNS